MHYDIGDKSILNRICISAPRKLGRKDPATQEDMLTSYESIFKKSIQPKRSRQPSLTTTISGSCYSGG